MSDYVSRYCLGERCQRCDRPARHKIEEVIFDDDPVPIRHPLTAYLCDDHFWNAVSVHRAPPVGSVGTFEATEGGPASGRDG